MSRDQMKSLLLRDKEFLKELKTSDNVTRTKKILQNASDAKLNTLIRLINFICNGQIPIKKSNFEKVKSNHLNIIKKNFEKKTSLQALLIDERAVKLKILLKLSASYEFLLSPLFSLN